MEVLFDNDVLITYSKDMALKWFEFKDGIMACWSQRYILDRHVCLHLYYKHPLGGEFGTRLLTEDIGDHEKTLQMFRQIYDSSELTAPRSFVPSLNNGIVV